MLRIRPIFWNRWRIGKWFFLYSSKIQELVEVPPLNFVVVLYREGRPRRGLLGLVLRKGSLLQ